MNVKQGRKEENRRKERKEKEKKKILLYNYNKGRINVLISIFINHLELGVSQQSQALSLLESGA